MRTLRCKCGARIAWTTDGFQDCQGCTKCNTTYSDHPDYHKELQPHVWTIKYNQNTGKPYNICSKCSEIEQETYIESRRVDKIMEIPEPDIIVKVVSQEVIEDEKDIVETPIPKDLDEAIKFLTNDENIQFAKNNTGDGFNGHLHMFTGMGIRNSWGLWKGSELRTWFNDRGIYHADDMTGIIFTSFHRVANGKDIKLDEQIKFYRNYWEINDPLVNAGFYNKIP